MENSIFSILDLIKCPPFTSPYKWSRCILYEVRPATGVLWLTRNSPYFLRGNLNLRGRNNGIYPYGYLESIDWVFGPEKSTNTIEVCSGSVASSAITVDINPNNRPDIVDDGQELSKISDCSFNRWRCDPPYNARTADEMYGTEMPSIQKLLKAGARVCKPGSLLFLLLGNVNHQQTPASLKRIGYIDISIIPNSEKRTLHIYYKTN